MKNKYVLELPTVSEIGGGYWIRIPKRISDDMGPPPAILMVEIYMEVRKMSEKNEMFWQIHEILDRAVNDMEYNELPIAKQKILELWKKSLYEEKAIRQVVEEKKDE